METELAAEAQELTIRPRTGNPREVLQGANFTARDLALCSSEEARALIAYRDARELEVLPLSIGRVGKSARLHLAAVSDSLETEGRCQYACGVGVAITKVPRHLIGDAIELAYLGSEERLARHVDRLRRVEAEKPRAVLHDLEPCGDAAQFLQTILEFAVIRGASDLHLVPQRDGALIKLRVDGELLIQEQRPYALRFHEQVVSRLKVLAAADITQKAIPHDGAFSFNVGTSQRSARLSTLPTLHGESVVIRILRASDGASLMELGLEPSAYSMLHEMLQCPEGLVLLTGPTGSGKTTTLYSLLRELEGRGRNVVTVEDPVETIVPGIVQVQVNLDVGLDYPRAIRSVLRHDPDVLLIGEIRDGLSGSMAVDAATTGHLTVSSLHVGSVFDVVRRLEVLGVPPGRVVPALRLVVNQRLLPRLCTACRSLHSLKYRGAADMNHDEDACIECRGTGFSGQVLVTEVLDAREDAIQDLFLRGAMGSGTARELPADLYIPWSEALQYHMSAGAISFSQVEEFFGKKTS